RPRSSLAKGHCQEQRTILERFEVMLQTAIEREYIARWQAERSTCSPNLDVPPNRLDRDAAFRVMTRYACVRSQHRQDDAEILVLDEGLRILSSRPFGFLVELRNLVPEIELEVLARHRLGVRPSMPCRFVWGVCHRLLQSSVPSLGDAEPAQFRSRG